MSNTGGSAAAAHEPRRIGPPDPRDAATVNKRFNIRFIARPDCVQLAASTADMVVAVQAAVDEHRRVVVTSGGHCLEGHDPQDPHRDLWWAHTGGEGGNLGIVTRCWFRAPDAEGGGLDRRAFARLLRNQVKAQWDPLNVFHHALSIRSGH